MDILEQARGKLRQIIIEHKLDQAERITIRALSPDEAIGSADGNFVIKKGKERVIEARFRETAGQAFTDAPGNWEGTLGQLMKLELSENGGRALFTAGLNAVMNALGLVTGAIHCRDDEPARCGAEMPELLRLRFKSRRYGMIGLQPAILKEMVDAYGTSGMRVMDLNPDNIGRKREDLIVMNGDKDLDELLEWCQVGLVTGSTVVNGTINDILERFRTAGKPVIFYGNTISGVAALLDLARICPFGR